MSTLRRKEAITGVIMVHDLIALLYTRIRFSNNKSLPLTLKSILSVVNVYSVRLENAKFHKQNVRITVKLVKQTKYLVLFLYVFMYRCFYPLAQKYGVWFSLYVNKMITLFRRWDFQRSFTRHSLDCHSLYFDRITFAAV